MSTKKLIAFSEAQLDFIAKHRQDKGGSFQSFVAVAVSERIKQLNGIKLFLEEREAAKKSQSAQLSELEALLELLRTEDGQKILEKLKSLT